MPDAGSATMTTMIMSCHLIGIRNNGFINYPLNTRRALSTNDFTLSGLKTVLGFQIQRHHGSLLDPAAVQILNASGNPVATRLSSPNLPANAQYPINARSLVIAELAVGNYTLKVKLELTADFG